MSANDPLRFLADLTEDGQTYVAVRGGMGGRGNATFRSKPGRPAPRDFQPGEPGMHLVSLPASTCPVCICAGRIVVGALFYQRRIRHEFTQTVGCPSVHELVVCSRPSRVRVQASQLGSYWS